MHTYVTVHTLRITKLSAPLAFAFFKLFTKHFTKLLEGPETGPLYPAMGLLMPKIDPCIPARTLQSI